MSPHDNSPGTDRDLKIHTQRLDRLLKTSPRYDAFRREWLPLGQRPAGDTEATAFMIKLWSFYLADHNRFMGQPSVVHATAMLSPATQLHVFRLAEQEHSFVSKALQQPATRVKALRGFYGSTYRARLYQQLLPHETLPGAYCNGRLEAVSKVKSFDVWDDRAFYQAGVLRLLQMRAQLGIEPNQAAAPIISMPPQRRVERTVERDAEGVIVKLIDTPVEG